MAAKKQAQIDWFYKKLSQRFNTKNLGEIFKILGVRVTRDRGSRAIYLNQEQYLTTVLNKFGITQEKHSKRKTPAPNYKAFQPATDKDT